MACRCCQFCYKAQTKCSCARGKQKRGNYTTKYNIDQKRWDAVRKEWLANNPLCVHCQANGIIKESYIVDHIIDHKNDERLIWDETNYQSLCVRCHNIKTARTR